MPVISTEGAASAKGYGFSQGAKGSVNYIEDVFSTYLYPSSSGTDVAIDNGIDLSTKGGMVWIKSRTTNSTNNYVLDTARGSSSGNSHELVTNSTAAQNSGANLDYLTFNTNGFTAKAVSGGGELGTNTYYGDMVSWTFRKQPKFFDVVTYTGDGNSNQVIPHNLGSVPGCIIVKSASSGAASSNWITYHRSLGNTKRILLNTTGISTTAGSWDNTNPTTTDFTVGADSNVNGYGQTFVAYLFAHDAGGFGTAGTDNVISCGSFTDVGSGGTNTINLGYEPQWVLVKRATGGTAYYQEWRLIDNMRGMAVTGAGKTLYPNLSDSEGDSDINLRPNATGFTCSFGVNTGGSQYIYIAIRRGPMKTPTDGTKVFSPSSSRQTSSTSTPNYVSNFPVDLGLVKYYTAAADWDIGSRLTGQGYMHTNTTDAEANSTDWQFYYQNGFGQAGSASTDFAGWSFRRAPGFFDEVCYTGTGSATTVTHNLGVAPELIIVKRRNSGENWIVGASSLNWTSATGYLFLNSTSATGAAGSRQYFATTAPTSTVFSLSTEGATNGASSTYIAYLFASCPGVSKVGSYTGNGSTQTINCGFTGGARFVLIKRTDSTGGWYVYDTARGMTVLTDPYLQLNSTAAQSATLGSVTTVTTGFALNASILAAINTNGASYIYMAIA